MLAYSTFWLKPLDFVCKPLTEVNGNDIA